MIFETLTVSMFQVNCYVLGSEETREALVIDPGGEVPAILEILRQHDLTLKMILATHGHVDHVGGVKELKERTGAEFLAHPAELELIKHVRQFASFLGVRTEDCPSPDRLLDEGDEVRVGEIWLRVLHTPGHSPGGICLYGDGYVFSGDTLFFGSIGRTDFPGCSYDDLIRSVRTKLFHLGDHFKVYPGHMNPTTIGFEREYNPFCRDDES